MPHYEAVKYRYRRHDFLYEINFNPFTQFVIECTNYFSEARCVFQDICSGIHILCISSFCLFITIKHVTGLTVTQIFCFFLLCKVKNSRPYQTYRWDSGV